MLKIHTPGFFTALIIGLLWTTALPAQITITSDEIDITFGTMMEEYLVSGSVTVDLGSTGGPQSWIFDKFMFPGGISDTLTIVDPAGTPLADSFPDADHAWRIIPNSMNPEDTTEAWTYFNLTSDALFWLGAGSIFEGTPFAIINEPPSVALDFPATLGSSWMTTFVSSVMWQGFELRDSTTLNYEVDAYGTITVPLGTFECLRVRENEITVSKTITGGMVVFEETTTFINYIWVTEQYGLLATVESFDGETNPNYTLAEAVSMRGAIGSVGIDSEPAPVGESFDLRPNYPNPFNPETVIRYQLSVVSEVELAVFNLSGQKVATLYVGRQTAGVHQAVWDGRDEYGRPVASGVYFYKLATPSFTRARKMTLLR